MNIQQAFELSLQHHQAGRLQEAEQLYRQILAQQPTHPDALHLLGVIAHQTGRYEAAVDLIRQAILLKPNFPEACNNLGNALKENRQTNEAIAAFRRALALNFNFPEAHSNLGNALQNQGQHDAAIAEFRQALALNPNYPQTHYNLALSLRVKGLLDEAIAAHRQALALQPNFPEALSGLGNALSGQGKLEQAASAYRQAISLNPNYAEAYCNLGTVLLSQKRLDESIAAYRHALLLKPNFPEAHGSLGVALKVSGQLDQSISAYRQALALNPDYAEAHSNLVYALHYHSDYDAHAIAQENRRWNQRHAEPLRQLIQPHRNDRSPDRRLRIGYFSPYFHGHVVGRFILPLLTCHDHEHFEIFAYSQVMRPDPLTQELQRHTDHWRSLVGLSDEHAAQLIREDRIDILVDLNMHMAQHRLLVFARKPAPIQVTYLAYCSTTGLSTIDYRISDPYLDPPGQDESVYTEKTLRLPHTFWCYEPVNTHPIGPLPALHARHITFGCLNNFGKVTEPALAAWARLLQAIPDSQLLLHAHEGSHRERTANLLRHLGVDPQRLRFCGFVPLAEYLQLYQQIDIALDPFPYAGGTTTCDALWMGVPVVSLLGKTAVGRSGWSILSNVGLPELVARSVEEYVRLAAALAGDLPRLKELRSSLRERMERSPLMDAPRFARAMETAYRQIWNTYLGETNNAPQKNGLAD